MITVRVEFPKNPKRDPPRIYLQDPDRNGLGQLDLDFEHLEEFKVTNGLAWDFVLLAAAVYALDKLIERDSSTDAWTREISVSLPVSDPKKWESASKDIQACLSFLTGDYWFFSFTKRAKPLSLLEGAEPSNPGLPKRPAVVCLFSGGLDSLIGAIDWLEANPPRRIALVGHHDGMMPGPFSDQRKLCAELETAYPNRIDSLLVRVGHTAKAGKLTLRGRSLLFLSLGVAAASAMRPGTSILIPENGTIALNVPLTPSRRGSCSTRTAHPHFIRSLRKILSDIGLPSAILNPLELKTKGEAAAKCKNPGVLKKLYPLSVSCAKRGHTKTWKNRAADSCGRCMPCIYRRAALHSIMLDDQHYGVDTCNGEVDLEAPYETGPNDLRACLSFLRRNLSRQEIEKLLLSNGSLPLDQLGSYADVVVRAMNEIREWLGAKAIPKIKKRAGING